MALKSTAAALIEGPITDAGQLLLALVINELAGPDGWTYTTTKQLAKLARLGRTAGYNKLAELEKIGVIERQNSPTHAVRVVHQAAPEYREAALECHEATSRTNRRGCREVTLECREATPECRQTDSPDASAYLPKRSKDLKEEDVEITASPSSAADLVLVADNPSPENTRRLDQPAAQPPAIVEQAEGRPDELLPAKRKAAPLKAKRAGSVIALPDDWRADDKLLASLAKNNGIPIEFSQRLIDEFVDYWRESGGRKKSWNQAFRNWARSEWEKEQKRAKNQRYTDASGRSISERDATTRERNQRFLATLESGLLDNFDLDQPV